MGTKKKVRVIIPRRLWCRGAHNISGLLIDKKQAARKDMKGNPIKNSPKMGTMCCLGHGCLALGYTPSQIRGKGMPNALEVEIPNLVVREGDEEWGEYGDTRWAEDAQYINDDGGLSDNAREARLTELCQRPDSPFEFVFTDDARSPYDQK